MDGLNDLAPGIVHFSGHGYSGEIAVDHAKVKRPSGKILTFRPPRQSCRCGGHAATSHCPQFLPQRWCKGLSPARTGSHCHGNSISDLAATAFAAQFYAAVAAGQSLKAAFAQGVVAIEAVSLNEAKTPQLILADGVNAANIVLA